VTVTLQRPVHTAGGEMVPVGYASWGARLGAFALDVLPGAAVAVTMGLLAYTRNPWGLLWWIFAGVAAAALTATLINRLAVPTVTGWSLGRAVFGIRVVRSDGRPAGFLRLLIRDVAHLLDTATAFIGWLWPLWDRRHRTFADMLLRTEVHAVDRPERNVRRIAAWVMIVAALACVLGAGLEYATVYRHDRAVERARMDIAEKGPPIVEKLLSYHAASVRDDFRRAQSLTTDDYRPRLIAQQESVEKAGGVTNEYWTTNSAVLTAGPRQAAMLLALQGQRGDDPKDQRFITATVRVDFDKSADGQWRVAQLTVLKKPQPNGPAR
jgi:Mce-associated membrane protein